MRGIPIFTFINKLDRPSREPLALLDEIEAVLGIGAVPINWPIGDGLGFRGVYDRSTQLVYQFAIGNTLCTGPSVEFHGIPSFQPEHFAVLHNTNTAKYKQFQKGLRQLEEQGEIQILYAQGAVRREPILAAVGQAALTFAKPYGNIYVLCNGL